MPPPKTPPASNPSIIETIDKMVKEGESEEKILSTLKDIGISPDNSRRLLILGQADVFSLLKGEIKRTVRDEMVGGPAPQAGKPGAPMGEKQEQKYLAELKEYEKAMARQNEALRKELDDKIRRITEMEEKTKTNYSSQSKVIQEQVMASLREYEKGIAAQNKTFQEQVASKISKGSGLSEKARQELTSSKSLTEQFSESFRNHQKSVSGQNQQFQAEVNQKLQRINELEERTQKRLGQMPDGYKAQEEIGQKLQKMGELEEKNQKRLNQMADEVRKVEADLGEAGLRGVGTRNKLISYAVITLGLIFGAGTLYLFYTNVQEFTTQSIITLTIMAIITVTLLVVGTLI